MPGGCKEGVRAALRSPAALTCASPGSDTRAAPLVAALQGNGHDRAACCRDDTPPLFQTTARVMQTRSAQRCSSTAARAIILLAG